MTIRPILLILISENLYQIFVISLNKLNKASFTFSYQKYHIFVISLNKLNKASFTFSYQKYHIFVISLNKLNKACFTFSYQIFVISLKKLNRKLWGDDIVNSLVCLFVSSVQEEMFHETLRNFTMSTSLFEIRFSLCYLKLFILSIELILTLTGLIL